MLIDTHAHINFRDFKDDADEVIQRSLQNNIWIILVGSEYKTSKRAVNYADKYKQGVYSTVGLHPIHLEDAIIEDQNSGYCFTTHAEKFLINNYKQLAQSEKVVAIGEIGLDYYHIDLNKDILKIKKKQQDIFIQQLKLAIDLNLPVIIHCRESHNDVLAILQDFKEKYHNILTNSKPWGVIHCFSGNEDSAKKYFELGLAISFTGLITFNAQWDDLISNMSLDRLMIETDCPYMTPKPHRGERNEPIFVKYIAQKIAQLRKLSIEEISKITTDNAKKFFNL